MGDGRSGTTCFFWTKRHTRSVSLFVFPSSHEETPSECSNSCYYHLPLCVNMAPHYSLGLAFPAQPAMLDSRAKSSLSPLELSIIEAQRGSTEQQQERRSERATKAAASTEGTAHMKLSSSSPRLPKDRGGGRRRGVLSEHQPILRPRSQILTQCLDGFLERLYATGPKKRSSWYSVKAFSTAAVVILVLVVALQGVVSSPTDSQDRRKRFASVGRTVVL